MENLLQEFLVENSSVNVEFLENKTGEIATQTYLLSIAEVINCSANEDWFSSYFDSGTAVPLQFDALDSLEIFLG